MQIAFTFALTNIYRYDCTRQRHWTTDEYQFRESIAWIFCTTARNILCSTWCHISNYCRCALCHISNLQRVRHRG